MIIQEDIDEEEDGVTNNKRDLLRFYQVSPQSGYYIFVTDATKK